MHPFLQRHAEKVMGMLNGWDRIRLRSTLRWLANLKVMTSYLYAAQVLLKDFKAYAQQANRNAIKMYDKQGSVLRVETTINDEARHEGLSSEGREGQAGQVMAAPAQGNCRPAPPSADQSSGQ